jgi:phage terminase small subunit
MATQIALSPPPTAPPQQISLPWYDGLTEKRRAFVEHYYRYRNATQAYKAAYDTEGSNYDTCAKEGQRLLRDDRIQAAIAARCKISIDNAGFDAAWLLRRFLDIATADPRELIGLKVGCCRHCHGDDHRYQWREREYMEAIGDAEWQVQLARLANRSTEAIKYPDPAGGFGFNATLSPHPGCPECHGEGTERFVPRDTDNLSDQAMLLYGGVKVKNNGAYEIIIADRGKAAELAGRIVGAFNDKINVSGLLGHMHAVADLRKMDPQEAARAYRDFVSGHLQVG